MADSLTGKPPTDAVWDSARRAAQDELLDRTGLEVDPEAYEEFLARLDAPPNPTSQLRRALQTPAPWDE